MNMNSGCALGKNAFGSYQFIMYSQIGSFCALIGMHLQCGSFYSHYIFVFLVKIIIARS